MDIYAVYESMPKSSLDHLGDLKQDCRTVGGLDSFWFTFIPTGLGNISPIKFKSCSDIGFSLLSPSFHNEFKRKVPEFTRLANALKAKNVFCVGFTSHIFL